ncbi:MULTISPECIES: SDH family Clp fold serine proteinase [Capnocytophaga]|uniref:ATP-dependent Clp protease proteolytic subunit n=1 Tax=Capnocytophaga stomatis TaxID=1848904 RepID=A0ABW8QAD5_9FLAO|nr:ATP-dependent Clp protease proteolytic subunit [Capnocytophaga stomatis]GIJ93725.1 hypothetical protein CAPN002_09430 [Capnocytophaga stomatis]
MRRYGVDKNIQLLLNQKLTDLEEFFKADFLVYYGGIVNGVEEHLLTIVEDLVSDNSKKDKKIYIILTTGGGSATTVERFVNILRYHYEEVNFIVPDYAYSAGTIFCMSGDNIYMDYFSVLGPIDPQVQSKDGKWVAALGYLDKVNELIEKARNGVLTQPEFLILKDLDLAELREYEQAKNLTIDLLKKWLVKYKFKNWTQKETSKTPVTEDDKIKRAEEIADKLSNSNEWKSHGRPINIETLENHLNLKIVDYSGKKYRVLIREYYELLSDYVEKNNLKIFIHTRKFI